MKNLYEIVYYCGDDPSPSYHVIDWFNSDNEINDISENLPQIVYKVRTIFGIESSVPDEKIHEELYIFKESTIMSIKDIISVK